MVNCWYPKLKIIKKVSASKSKIKVGQIQGGIKLEISWEPNFPVNDFARNNGKNRVIFLAVNRKIILFTGNIKNILIFYDKNVICLACHKKYISCAMKYSSYGTRCSLFFL